MNILQICNKIPYAPKDGGSIAMNILTEGFIAQGNTVHVLAMSTPKQSVKETDVDATYKSKTAFQSVFIDTSVRPLAAFINLFTGTSYNISRFYSKAFEVALIEKLKSFPYDVIQLESLWVTMYLDVIRKHSKAKVVLRSHNVEYLIWERLANACSNPIKKAYLKMLASRLKSYELSLLNNYDAIASITDVDAAIYKKAGCQLPMITIPFGIAIEKYVVNKSGREHPSLFHIGAMDWQPNMEAIQWFLKAIWPEVTKRYPDLKLYLAGRNMSSELKNLQLKNLVVVGEVENATSFMNSKSMMIVPLLSGGGMRVKIVEGLALGKTIISTSIGAEGIAYENKKNILIADTVSEFVLAIASCIEDNTYCDRIGTNGRTLAETTYNNSYICSQLSEFYKTLLRK